ncbi:MAG: PKD domain-containing protein, partial [Ferruginibacter sp.]
DQTVTTRPTYKWWWDFGDPTSGASNNSILQNPSHTFSGPGTYNVRFTSITTPGCLSDTFTRQVIVNPLPVGNVGPNFATCQNAPTVLVFTGTVGTAPFTFTYNINNGPAQTAVTTSGNSISVPVPTGTTGTFAYHLVNVSDAAGTNGCNQNIADTSVISVNPLPSGSITTSSSVLCQNAASPFITFTGANAINLPYTFTYNINGGANLTVTTTVLNSVNVPVPTNIAGTFTYNLLSVGDGSSIVCSQAQTGSVAVLVKALPTASIEGTINVCLNATAPNITFTGATGVAPFTFTYTINGGPNQTVTTTVGNSVTVAAPTTLTGTFVYSLVSVSEGSADNCFQLQTGNATVVVNPLPSATIAGATSICLNGASPNVTFTGSGSIAPYTFTYNINGGANQIVTTTVGNTVTVAAPTNVAGTFTYNLVSVQDASTTSCSQIQSGATSIIIKPLPTATIAGTTSVCLNGVSPNITFTAAIGTAPYIFTYNINGGATQTVTTSVANSVTVAVPTTTTGTFTYNLLSVQEGSANACLQIQTGNAVVIVNPLPTATMVGSTAVCLNTPSPNITFTGAAGTAPYTFTYNINGGANQTVTTTAGNAATVAAATNASGTFTYNLISVQDASSSICSQAQTGNAVVIIHPLPTPEFSFTIPTCETRLISFTDNAVPNVGTLTNWLWNFGDPSSGINNISSLQNPTHTFSTAGNYTVSLIVTTSNSCSNVLFSKIVTINDRPLAGYIIPEVCLSDTYAQFLDTSKINNGAITAWAWNFGDINSTIPNPNTSTLQNPTHSYTAVGSYIVQLISTSNNGCKDTLSQTLVVNGSFPVANFTVNNLTSLCANDSVAIVNTSTVFPGVVTKVEIYWDNVNFPTVFQTDDVPFPGKVYRHLYPNFQTPLTKTFTIRYRAYSGGVCVNDKIATITVNASPSVLFNPMPNSCLNLAPFQITQATETGGVPGTGVFSGPGVNASGIFDPSLVGSGTYTIRYLFTSTAGCVDSAAQQITVLRAPVATFTAGSPTCEKQTITFTQTSSSADGLINTYTWNFGDGTPPIINSIGNPVTHIFAAYGTYTASLMVTTNDGCNSSVFTLPVLVNPLPVPNFSFPATVCLPVANVQFTDVSSIADGTENAFTYSWNFGDPSSGAANTSTARNPSHIYNTVGPFNVTLRVTSGVGCSKDTIIVINNINPQPIAAFNLLKPSVCLGETVSFIDQSNGLNGVIQQWNWDFGVGTGFSTLTPTPTFLYSTTGDFTVVLNVVNSFGCRDTVSRLFTVYPNPVVNLGNDKFVLEGGSLVLQPSVIATIPQYVWTPATYLNNPNIEAPTSAPLMDITYTLTVTDRGGCATSDDVFVKVLLGPKIPNTFSPNGDGINERWVIEYLETYPNCRVQVFTRTGQKVFESRGYNTPWNGTLNGKPLPIDTYYYIVEPENGRKPITGYVTIIK